MFEGGGRARVHNLGEGASLGEGLKVDRFEQIHNGDMGTPYCEQTDTSENTTIPNSVTGGKNVKHCVFAGRYVLRYGSE